MLAKLRYKKAVTLVSKWPLDPSKGTRRDLGALLRAQVQRQFRKREDSLIEDPQLCDEMLKSIENIVSDKYRTMYSMEELQPHVSALGMPLEVTQFAVSAEGHAIMKEEAEMGVMRKMFHQLTRNKFRQYTEHIEGGVDPGIVFGLQSGEDNIKGIGSGEDPKSEITNSNNVNSESDHNSDRAKS